MGTFVYQATDPLMGFREGLIEAETQREASELLLAQGLLPTSVVPAPEPEDAGGAGEAPDRPRLPEWRLRTEDGQRVEFRRSRLRGRLMGIPFLVAASAVAAILWEADMGAWVEGPISALAAFAGAGGVVELLGSGRMTVDRAARRIVRDWGLGPYRFRPRIIDAKDAQAVVLSRRVTYRQDAVSGGGIVATQVFAVAVRKTDGVVEELDSGPSEPIRRALAQKVADYLNVPLVVAYEPAPQSPAPAP